MRLRFVLALALATVLIASVPGMAAVRPERSAPRDGRRFEAGAAKEYIPAVAAARGLDRYFVVMKAESLADHVRSAGGVSDASQKSAVAAALASQEAAIADAKARGGLIVFRYGRVVNAFSAKLSRGAAAALAKRADVASVQPVSIVQMHLETSVPFIGAPEVWAMGANGRGMRVALVDTGIDYTHAAFGGTQDYDSNDPEVIEPGTFPTTKVIGGHDFVGEDYDLFDGNPNNDIPVPDPDPLDINGHGTHTGSTCCGFEVAGSHGKGVAPRAKLYGLKVWDEGNSTDDVLVAAYEWAVDPNQDGDPRDKAHVLSFSGGVTFGTRNSVEAMAAQAVVDLGTVFVASAGNSGNQPVGGSAYVTGTPATASGVISVAASIDEFVAQTLSVNAPEGVELPDGGIIVHQDWSPELTEDLTDDVFDVRAIQPPGDPGGDPAPGDRYLCDVTPPGLPLAGEIALVFKGSTGQGDCDGSEKVFRAQEAGAIGVILWNGFGGLPFGLAPGEFADDVVIPAVMTSTPDSEALGAADSPDAPVEYNTGGLNVTIHADPEPIPGFDDLMTDFTSEGPARTNSELKPDISAPGFNIRAAAVGTGDGAAVLSGTSMAAPHVSGVATLLRQLFPSFNPAQIKGLLMNHATQAMRNNDFTEPVSATIMGSGRVQAGESARTDTLAGPASLSFGLRPVPTTRSATEFIRVRNLDNISHRYRVAPNVRYADFNPDLTEVEVSLNGTSWRSSVEFTVGVGRSRKVFVRLTLHPEFISEAEQEYGWYYFHPNMDGNVGIRQRVEPGRPADSLHVPWHVAPLTTSDDSMSESELDLTGGPATMTLESGPAAGNPHADLYLLGAFSDTTSLGEEDIAAIGARSFTGPTIDGVPEGVPEGTDELAGITWIQFLTADDEPTEPVEFGVQTYGVRNITETLEVDVLIDAGADGVFADPGLRADYMVVKQAIPGGFVCVYDLSLPNPFDECTHTYFPDYSNYNSNLVGLVVDASAIGLNDLSAPELSYMVVACTGRYSGDVPDQICDEAGGFDGTTYTARLHATNPALDIDPLVCRGFWDGGNCDDADPITVSVGSAGPGDNPSILVLFSNNAPATEPTVIRTTT